MVRLKEKSMKFIRASTVHGVSRIVKTDHYLVKLVWTVMILISVSSGLYIISKTVNDYNKYDVITNIERVQLKQVIFPAITVCFLRHYNKSHFINNTLIRSEITSEGHFKDFFYYFKSPNLETNLSKLEFFKKPTFIEDCVRFNGAANINLETVSKNTQFLNFRIHNSFDKNISRYEFIRFTPEHSSFYAYIGNNYLNSYLDKAPIVLNYNSYYFLTVEQSDIENKLGEPYNQCENSLDKKYFQLNCIEECISMKIKNKYNCSVPSFYTIKGLKPCFEYCPYDFNATLNTTNMFFDEFRRECYEGCPKNCESIAYRMQVSGTRDDYGSTYLLISFSDFSTFNITQIPKMNEFSLISGIGGSLGLFIGVRFLTLVELLEFFLDIFFVLFIDRF